ncbi:unannotated protein [freshwater metagenome]|uniref:Unannotated protein n=1 Tax=freshwater metagenome TaxID=449393 RepID=A0A6J6I2T4_9ZZZZ
MTTAAPQGVEDRAEWNPAFDLLVGATNRKIVGNEEGFAIADEEVWLKSGACETSTEHGDRAHTGSEDFSVAAERVGHSNDTDFTKGCIAHRAATAFW